MTDLDGTLLHPSGRVHDRDRTVIAALRERGVVVTIATGRMYSGTKGIARSLELTGPVACVDGSHIVDLESDAHLANHPLSNDARCIVRNVLEDMAIPTVVFSGDVIHHDDRALEYLPYLRTWSERVTAVDNILLENWWLVEAEPSATVSLGRKRDVIEARERILELSDEDLNVAVFPALRSEDNERWGMIVRASGVTKGTALSWLANYHRIPIEQTIAVGDWINDVPMLERAGRSFAMAQAPGDVIDAADEHLDADSLDGGAIAEIAERCALL